MAKQRTSVIFFFIVLLLLLAVMGGLFYQFVLQRFDPRTPQAQPPPKKEDLKAKIYPINPEKETAIPEVVALPGTSVLRLAHRTWNAHQAWALANMGKITDPGSLFARHGITMHFQRIEEVLDQIEALKAFADALNRGDEHPDEGVHFFTISGDASAWVIHEVNTALKTVNPNYEAEIIGFSGLSAGENKFMGPPEWQASAEAAKGGVVAGVPCDGDWNVMVFWCVQHQIPLNSDQDYYDPNALNFVETDSAQKAAEMYIEKKTVKRIFTADGDNRVKKGQKRPVEINAVVTHTPLEKRIALQRGELVTIASTQQYANQMPQYIVGLKPWNLLNRDLVVNMLAAIFSASDRIRKSDSDLKAEVQRYLQNQDLVVSMLATIHETSDRIQESNSDLAAIFKASDQIRKRDGDFNADGFSAKSDNDYRWKAAQYVYELFDAESPDDWYAYYDGIDIVGKKKNTVNVGGASVSNLQQNLLFCGLSGGGDIGKAIYHRFAQLVKTYYPTHLEVYAPWAKVFNAVYLEDVLAQFPQLGQSDPNLPTFVPGQRKNRPLAEFTYRILFDSAEAVIGPEAEVTLTQMLQQIVLAPESRFEIHAHTDSMGRRQENMRLSRQRSEAVRDWLLQRLGTSFSAARIKVVPHGEDELLVPDEVAGEFIPEKMSMNRRVVLKVLALK